MPTITKISANQLWKDELKSGQTTLEFVPWLQQHKAKVYQNWDGTAAIPFNKALNDSIQTAIKDLHERAGEKTEAGKDYFMGIPKSGLIISGIVIVVITGAVLIYLNSQS